MTSSLSHDGSAADWFCELMKDLAASYPNFRANERQTRVYAAALHDLTPAQVRNAMGRAIMESKFFPSVAELRQYVEPSHDDRAMLAWLTLRDAVASIGAWRSVVIDDACAAEALLRVAGSWPVFCDVPTGPELMVMRQGFVAAYRAARRHTPRDAEPVKLAGLCEASGPILEASDTIARLTLDGQVLHGPAALPSAERKQLPAGDV